MGLKIKKWLSAFVSVLLIANSFSVYLVPRVFSEDTQEVQQVQEEQPQTIQEGIVLEEVAPTPEAISELTERQETATSDASTPTPIAEGEQAQLEPETPTPSPEPIPTPTPEVFSTVWLTNEDGSYTSVSPVEMNVNYVSPFDSNLIIKFTELPSISSQVTIRKIETSLDLGEDKQVGSVYEITSSMLDGDFAYDLTLPVPSGTETTNLTLKYAESLDELKDGGEPVDGEKEVSDDSLTVKNLDHFTVFVLVNDLDNGGTVSTTDDITNGTLATLKDAWINESSSTQNNGDDTSLKVRSQNLSRNQRALIQFDTSSVNSSSTVDKATLRLYMTTAPSNNRTYEIYRITPNDWVEGNGGTNNSPVGEVRWDNQPSLAGAATSSTSTGTANQVWLEWDVTGDVQNFVNGTYSNYGWLIKDASESESATSRDSVFRSRDNGTQNQRPQLVVDFATAANQPTEYKSPSSQAAATGGDGNGYETNPTNAFADAGGSASDVNGGASIAGDKHIFYDYGFTIPVGSTINGIEVRADWYMDQISGVNSLSTELSWDGGTTWTSAKSDTTETDKEHIVSFGGSSDTWGRSWSYSEFSNSNFRVRVTNNADNVNRDFFLDWIPVRVYYTADVTGPTLTEVTPVTTPTTDSTPDYTFNSDEAGAITYGGSCSSATTSAAAGNNTITFNSLADGTYSDCTITVTDAASNASTPLSATAFTIDTQAPQLQSFSTSNADDFYGPGQSVNISADYDEAPAAGSELNVTLDNGVSLTLNSISGNSIEGTYTVGATGSGEDTNDLTVNTINSQNVADSLGSTQTSTTLPGSNIADTSDIEIDTTAPSTSDSGTDTAWHTTNVTVTLTCNDGVGSGCDVIYWTTDGRIPTALDNDGAGSSVFLSADGEYTIKYFAIDSTDNEESVKTAANTVKIDKTAPDAPTASPAAGDYTSDQSVTLSSSDATSGVADIYYTLDGTTPDNTSTLYTGAITVDQDMTIKSIAYDNAGNYSSVSSDAYGIAPTISNEASSTVTETSATITWDTDEAATSRVVYDTVSHPVLGAAPNYDYSNSTVETDTAPMVTSHSVVLTGLTAGTTYYYRVISHASPEAVSDELSFTTTSSSSTTSGGGTVAGASTGGNSTPTCSATKPGSAPTLLSATGGLNSVLLSWSKASDPVTYYLVAYGTAAGSLLFGNPNVGDKNTTSYNVTGLSGETTYYFRVRAGNDCMPGDFSNELAAVPGGQFIEGPAEGFAQGVLGEATEEAKISPAGEDKGEILGKFKLPNLEKTSVNWLSTLIAAIIAGLLWLFFKNQKKPKKKKKS